jgi:hypothetical protein
VIVIPGECQILQPPEAALIKMDVAVKAEGGKTFNL